MKKIREKFRERKRGLTNDEGNNLTQEDNTGQNNDANEMDAGLVFDPEATAALPPASEIPVPQEERPKPPEEETLSPEEMMMESMGADVMAPEDIGADIPGMPMDASTESEPGIPENASDTNQANSEAQVVSQEVNEPGVPEMPEIETSPVETAPPENADGGGKSRVMLGERLIDEGAINEDQLQVALHEKARSGKMLGEVLVDLGFISANVLTGILSERTGYAEFDPNNSMLDPNALEFMKKEDALKYQALPVALDKEKNLIYVAMADPYDVVALDRLRLLLPKAYEIVPQICPPQEIGEVVDRAYGYASSIDGILRELAGEDMTHTDLEELTEETGYSHPIVRLVNALVFDAVKMGASDIHFEPEDGFIRMRYRVDGILKTEHTIHGEYWNGIAQRLKIMSGMNIADKMMPQDGRFYMNVGGREADFRVSSLPTVYGENIVLRVLDKQAGIMPMEALGFSERNMSLITRSQSRPEGIIIVTGPTGSGKTTSLYSMINAINTPDVNIMTLEDPVEYSLPMIRQTHVREGSGLTFADGLKALLRQDPDIIFVGEVRDYVTGEQALKAAMTGHQVYTTLHTNDSFGAIPRLLDMGMKPGMLAGAIISIFAQRLTRRLCSDCKVEKTATAEEAILLDCDPENPPQIFERAPEGCMHCGGTGYKGRAAVVEILYMEEELNDILAAGGNKTELKTKAKELGFKSMADDAVLKILDGITSFEAVSRVVDMQGRI